MLIWAGVATIGAVTALSVRYRTYKDYLERKHEFELLDWQTFGARTLLVTLGARGGRALPKWQPGAHLVLEIPSAQGGAVRRAFSLCGGTATSYQLAIACRPEGKLTGPLVRDLKKGLRLTAYAPRNRFFRLSKSRAPLALIGIGTGIAPLLPMARQALAAGRRVSVLYGARDLDSAVLHREFSALAEAEGMGYRLTLSQPAPDWQGARGRIGPEEIAHLVADHPGEICLCGSEPFLQACRATLAALGWQGRLQSEAFATAAPPANRAARISVNGQSFAQGDAPNLLAACEENGVFPFAECRSGQCRSCRVTVVAGEVSTPDGGRTTGAQILACQCRALGDVTLKL
ncbi:2Fe-2S iron-sulfur cluster-binding protein [Paracoccus aminophilus]|uniref:Flavodoxin reductase n=1 Tax=Paracoccus aminophilus JCM 7686 TaxID=1367847 RepID=S5XZN8_PARAH|nr:2Fe-2S iron-sulfur cluster-binding protein [Paracoccus aminophilus]AGT10757.1 flavodoxin reductase [Paracoccus aminophilus JCM 7686]